MFRFGVFASFLSLWVPYLVRCTYIFVHSLMPSRFSWLSTPNLTKTINPHFFRSSLMAFHCPRLSTGLSAQWKVYCSVSTMPSPVETPLRGRRQSNTTTCSTFGFGLKSSLARLSLRHYPRQTANHEETPRGMMMIQEQGEGMEIDRA